MPVFDFKCSCGAIRTELISVKKSDKIKFICDNCGKPMKKVFHKCPLMVVKQGKLGNYDNGYTSTK
jgi:predicted nucleic acid-binding Zn ribbon protein